MSEPRCIPGRWSIAFALAACTPSAPSTQRSSATPADRVESACELARDGGRDATQYLQIVVRSRDDISRLDLPNTAGVSLLDHPTADPRPDCRLGVGAYATSAGLATLCAHGCTPDRGCGIRVITTKQPAGP
jgi:hypothetical protein